MPGVYDRLWRKLHQRPHDRLAQIGVGAVSGRPNPADGVLEERVPGEDGFGGGGAVSAVRLALAFGHHVKESIPAV